MAFTYKLKIEELGTFLGKEMENTDTTYRALCYLSKVSPRTILRVKQGFLPKLETLQRILKTFGYDMEIVLTKRSEQ